MLIKIIREAVWWGAVCIIIYLLLYACKSEQYLQEFQKVNHRIDIGDFWNICVISNPGSKDFIGGININGRFYHSTQEIVEQIRTGLFEFSEESDIRKAWKFVHNNLNYNIPLTDAAWQHQPTVIFNSLGFGQCDDLASALAYIWKQMGYEVRIWNLSGHVVPEVFADGKWQMYDPSYEVFYFNEKGEVAGCEELYANPDLVTGKYGKLGIGNFKNLAELNFKVLRYSDEIKSLYKTGGKLVTEWHLPERSENMSFLIPAGGTVSFPVNSPNPVIINNWKGMKQQLVHYMRITIPKGWSGDFYCPLIISSISGAGALIINNKTVPLQDFAILFELSDTENPIQRFKVKEAKSQIEVYALINPWLFNLPGHNNINVTGYQADHLTIVTKKSETPYPTLVNHIMDHRYQVLPGHFVRYEQQKDTLNELMFSRDRPLQKAEDICVNANAYFSLWHAGSTKEKQERTNDICEKMYDFYEALPDALLKKEVLRFMSDPLAFIMLIYILEEYPEGTVNQML